MIFGCGYGWWVVLVSGPAVLARVPEHLAVVAGVELNLHQVAVNLLVVAVLLQQLQRVPEQGFRSTSRISTVTRSSRAG